MPFRSPSPPDSTKDLEPWVLLRTFTSLHEADMVRTQLEGHGVSAQLEDSTMAGVHPWIVPALGGVRLTIRETDLAIAREILEVIAGEIVAADEARSDDTRMSDEADAQARRAVTAAVFGLVILPVLAQLYSLYLLLTLSHAHLSDGGRRRMRVALTVDLVALTGTLALVVWVYSH